MPLHPLNSLGLKCGENYFGHDFGAPVVATPIKRTYICKRCGGLICAIGVFEHVAKISARRREAGARPKPSSL